MASKVIISFTSLSAEYFLELSSIDKWLVDAVPFSETTVFTLDKTVDVDTFSFVDASTTTLDVIKTDTFSFTDSAVLLKQVFRDFTDSFALDDFTSIDAISKSVEGTKSNVFAFSDDREIGVGKNFLNSIVVAHDSFFTGISKTADPDSFSPVDAITREFISYRVFSDSQSFSDVEIRHFNKGPADTQVMTESHYSDLSVIKTDATNLIESTGFAFSTPRSDAFSVGDSFTRSGLFYRTFNDAFALDDAVTVDALVKDTTAGKTNIVTLSESEFFTYEKSSSDTFSFADAEGFQIGKPASDSITLTESISYTLLTTAAMNAAQLNSAPFNE